MKQLTRYFLQGLVALLPIGLTLYAVYLVLAGTEALARKGLFALFGKENLPPGTGVAITVGVILLLGMLMNLWLFRRLVRWTEALFERIPGVKTLFNGIRDLMGFLSTDPEQQADTVVVVRLDSDRRLLGFVTRKNCEALPDALAGEDFIAVYVPMSYQLGGYTVFMPRDRVEPLDMDLETGMRLAVTGGVGRDEKERR